VKRKWQGEAAYPYTHARQTLGRPANGRRSKCLASVTGLRPASPAGAHPSKPSQRNSKTRGPSFPPKTTPSPVAPTSAPESQAPAHPPLDCAHKPRSRHRWHPLESKTWNIALEWWRQALPTFTRSTHGRPADCLKPWTPPSSSWGRGFADKRTGKSRGSRQAPGQGSLKKQGHLLLMVMAGCLWWWPTTVTRRTVQRRARERQRAVHRYGHREQREVTIRERERESREQRGPKSREPLFK